MLEQMRVCCVLLQKFIHRYSSSFYLSIYLSTYIRN